MKHDDVNKIRLNDKYLRLFGIPLSVILLLMAQMPFFFPGRWGLFWRYAIISVAFATLMWEIARWVLIRARRKFPALEQTKQRIGWMFFLFTIQLAIGQAFITQIVFWLGLANLAGYSFLKVWLINLASSLFFIVVISSAYEAIYFFNQYKIALLKSEQLKKEQAQQQIEALKNRVNPHFLFNSLTTLSALIGENPRLAEDFVDELSKVYRYLLKSGRQKHVPLGEELQFAESYAFLLKSRFEEGSFSIRNHYQDSKRSMPPYESYDQNIPLLTIQFALDYLVRTQNTPLHIQVYASDNHLHIACEHQPKTLSFDVNDNDWRQLESNGASQKLQEGQMTILIPFTSYPI